MSNTVAFKWPLKITSPGIAGFSSLVIVILERLLADNELEELEELEELDKLEESDDLNDLDDLDDLDDLEDLAFCFEFLLFKNQK